MEFASSSGYSLGVEIEFQILDRRDLTLVSFAPQLLEQAPKILRPRLSREFIKSILEIQTGVCEDLRDVENDLLQTCALAEEVDDCGSLSPYLLKANKWPAARHGLEGRFVDPTGILGDHPMQYRLAAMILKSRVASYGSGLGCESYLDHLDTIISGGTGADQMHRIYQQTNDFRRVVRKIQKEFWQ